MKRVNLGDLSGDELKAWMIEYLAKHPEFLNENEISEKPHWGKPPTNLKNFQGEEWRARVGKDALAAELPPEQPLVFRWSGKLCECKEGKPCGKKPKRSTCEKCHKRNTLPRKQRDPRLYRPSRLAEEKRRAFEVMFVTPGHEKISKGLRELCRSISKNINLDVLKAAMDKASPTPRDISEIRGELFDTESLLYSSNAKAQKMEEKAQSLKEEARRLEEEARRLKEEEAPHLQGVKDKLEKEIQEGKKRTLLRNEARMKCIQEMCNSDDIVHLKDLLHEATEYKDSPIWKLTQLGKTWETTVKFLREEIGIDVDSLTGTAEP